MKYELESKLRPTAVIFPTRVFSLQTGSFTFSKIKLAFCPCFSRIFNLLREPHVTMLCFVPLAMRAEWGFFFAGVSGSSCIFTLVLFVEIPLFELWCFTDMPAFAHWCFADSPTGLYQSCLIVHFVAPKITILPPAKRKTSKKMLTRPLPFLLKLRVYKPQSYLWIFCYYWTTKSTWENFESRDYECNEQNASSAFVTGYFFWQFACWASWKLTGFFFLVFIFFELSLLLLDTISWNISITSSF